MKTWIAGAALAAASAFAIATPAAAQTRLVLAHHSAIESQNTLAVERFKTCAERERVFAITHYPAGQLGTARELVEQLKLGAIDMSLTDTAYMSNLQPELAAFQLPFMFTDWAHAERAMDDAPGRTVADMLVRGQGVRPLAYMHNGFRDFFTVSRPILAIGDFRSMKLRSPPIPIWVRMFQLLEAQPVTVDWTEVYQAMQSGLVEGMESTPEGFVSSRSYEVGRHVTRTRHMYNLMMLVINERRFSRLSERERAVLGECAAEFRRIGNPEAIQLEEESYRFLAQRGIQMHDIDQAALRARLEPAWPQLVNNSRSAQELIAQIAAVR
ncbi:TRAP transporter substrate-binding protein [Falsiroseomonas sp. HW251]|uniref:TRAP transporter substrate-binding protein n=1 Tax=Falsiroseomonas sp. HW251 TaxID=3390998 RepID=UPI003D31F331